MRHLSELYKALDSKHDQKKVSDYSASDWTREAKTWTEIVDKTHKLHIGEIYDKVVSVSLLATLAQFARDQKLLEKAMDILKKLGEDAKSLKERFTKFSNKLKSKKPPKKKELDTLMHIFEI